MTDQSIDENEIATKRTIMVDVDGILIPRKIAIRRHNKNKPKKITPKDSTMTDKMTNEDSESRALRSNEYSLHTNPANLSKGKTKIRVKSKATGATFSMHDDMKSALKAHSLMPNKHKFFVEGFIKDQMSLARELMESRKDVEVSTKEPCLKFSDFRKVFEEQVAIVEAKIEEKKQLLLDKKKTVNDIELEENVFNWKANKPAVDWSDVKKEPEKASKPAKPKAEVDPNAPKRGRGRPAGKYGSYKVKERSAEDKKAIADKVHSNPERKKNYDAAIQARREFNKLMNDAIKAKQASLAASK